MSGPPSPWSRCLFAVSSAALAGCASVTGLVREGRVDEACEATLRKREFLVAVAQLADLRIATDVVGYDELTKELGGVPGRLASDLVLVRTRASMSPVVPGLMVSVESIQSKRGRFAVHDQTDGLYDVFLPPLKRIEKKSEVSRGEAFGSLDLLTFGLWRVFPGKPFVDSITASENAGIRKENATVEEINAEREKAWHAALDDDPAAAAGRDALARWLGPKANVFVQLLGDATEVQTGFLTEMPTTPRGLVLRVEWRGTGERDCTARESVTVPIGAEDDVGAALASAFEGGPIALAPLLASAR